MIEKQEGCLSIAIKAPRQCEPKANFAVLGKCLSNLSQLLVSKFGPVATWNAGIAWSTYHPTHPVQRCIAILEVVLPYGVD